MPSRPRSTVLVTLGVLLLAIGVAGAFYAVTRAGDRSANAGVEAVPTPAPAPAVPGSTTSSAGPPPTRAATSSTEPPATSTTTTLAETTTTTTIPFRAEGTVPGSTVGGPWGITEGLTMFRGNPTRTYYGAGPVPEAPTVVWRYPSTAMCGTSSAGGESKVWCGTGWTGQPVVWYRPDGVTEVIFGAYDKAVHFVDAETGRDTRPQFPVGDLIKGSVTLDPDGFPLLYFGSRDNKLRVVALDRDTPVELWSLDANAVNGIWNNDWDGNPAIVDDILYEGGENGWFFAIRLNRGYDGEGQVVVDPEILVQLPGYTDDLIARVGRNQSIENSVALYDRRVYFANSGGRVVGLDVADVASGAAPVVFDYWVGDDVDASIVIDEEGMLYVSVELERFNARSSEVGQLVKLDPYTDGDPLVWSVAVPPRNGGDGGLWATPALGDGYLFAATHPGELLVVDINTGEVVWRDEIGHHAWSSPVIVDETLVVATECEAGGRLRGYDLTDPAAPEPLWEATGFGGCVESTPAVWNGRIYVGSRDGFFYALA